VFEFMLVFVVIQLLSPERAQHLPVEIQKTLEIVEVGLAGILAGNGFGGRVSDSWAFPELALGRPPAARDAAAARLAAGSSTKQGCPLRA
jgi:hypothetical protein